MKKTAFLSATLILTIALPSFIALANDTENVIPSVSTKQTVQKKSEKAQNGLKDCLKKVSSTSKTSQEKARETYHQSLKSNLETFQKEMRTAKKIYKDGSKDDTAKKILADSKKSARTKYYDAIKKAQDTYREAKSNLKEKTQAAKKACQEKK